MRNGNMVLPSEVWWCVAKSANAPYSLVVMEDGSETIHPLDEVELESILASTNIKDMEPLDQEEIEQFLPDDIDADPQDASRPDDILLAIFGVVICAIVVVGIGVVIAVIVLLSKRKAA